MRRLRTRDFVIVGLVAFALGLLAGLPAQFALKVARIDGANKAVGTIWNGETVIGPATAVSWRVRPLRSLLRLGIAADVVMRGGETDIAAQGLWRPGRLSLDGVSGVAGPALFNTMIADLPITCDLSFVVDLQKVVLAGKASGAEGGVRSGPGHCSSRTGPEASPASIPAMIGRSVMTQQGSSAWLASASQTAGPRLARMTIDDTGKLTATILPAGASLLPATAGPLTIETQL